MSEDDIQDSPLEPVEPGDEVEVPVDTDEPETPPEGPSEDDQEQEDQTPVDEGYTLEELEADRQAILDLRRQRDEIYEQIESLSLQGLNLRNQIFRMRGEFRAKYGLDIPTD